MGRLFWKFFLFIWLIHVVGMVGLGTIFWMERHARQEQMQLQMQEQMHEQPGPGPEGPPPSRAFDNRPMPPPGMSDRPPPSEINRMPPGNNRGRPGFIPIEPLFANILVTLLCSALLARYFSRPIRNLRSAFHAVAKGNLQTRVGSAMGKRRDELSDLGRDFDRMAERLQTLVDSQRHLLHDVSHELRSPLARLQAAIGLIRQKPEKFDALLDRLELESARIDHLVGELLTISRLESGVMGELRDEVNMQELLEDIVADARFEGELKNHSVEFLGSAGVVVQGKAELLGRAIENVVRNALKHTPSDMAITIRAEHSATELKLSVLDLGPGVPEADLGKIFEPFYRSNAGDGTDGHGLGLALALRVVRAHGGSITASNRNSGGLCVSMTFPVKYSLA